MRKRGHAFHFVSLYKRLFSLVAAIVLVVATSVSIAYAEVPVVGFNSQPSQTSETAVTISVHINDTESDPVSIAIRYSLDDGVTWQNALHLSGASFPIVGNTITGITTYGDGPNNRSNVAFYWNFIQESGIESSDTVKIEVTPNDGSDQGTPLVSSVFAIVGPSAPVFSDESGEVTDITKTSAIVHYSISDIGSAELTDFELAYASDAYYLANASYDENDPITFSGAFSLTGATSLTGLDCGTTYHFAQSFTNGDDQSVTSDDATFTTSVCDEHLKFYWPLDEGTGTTTGVSSGYPGTLYGGTSWISGGGVSLDGINDYIRTDSTLTESMGVSDQAYTLSASVRVNEENETGNIIHISNNGNGIGWCIAMLHIEDGYFRAIGWDGDAVTAVNSVPAVPGEWYSIANTWSPDTNSLDLYVNGALIASTPMTTYEAANVPVYVFAGINATGCSNNMGWFKGDVKDVRIYSRAISEEEVEENANASLGTISADLFPEDDAEDVDIDTNLIMEFSTSTVTVGTGVIGIYRAQDDSLVEEFELDSDRLFMLGQAAIIEPAVDFDWDTEYYVYVPSTAFVDALGNTYPGTVSSSTWSFRTAEEPEEEDFGDDNDVPENSIYEMLQQYFGDSEDTTWTSVSASSDGNRLVAVGSGYFEGDDSPSGFVYTSNNGGADWELNTSSADMVLTSVTSSADGESIMAVGLAANGGFSVDFIVMKSTDGGDSWSTEVLDSADTEDFEDDIFTFYMALYLSRITASSDLSNIYVALYDTVYYSDNGGEDWGVALPLDEAVAAQVFPLSISSSADGSKILLAMSPVMYGDPSMIVVLFSDDYGETWDAVMTGEDEIIPFSVSISEDGERLFVVDTFTRNVHISNDDGESWTAVTNPDGYTWMYVAPSATGDSIVASAIEDLSEEYDDDLYWYKIHIYSSHDNGVSWTKQVESEPSSTDSGIESLIGQLVGTISGSYNLSNLGLVAFMQLFVITQEEPTLPEIEEEHSSSSRSGSRRVYGCMDETASNYTRFASHRQSMCVYRTNVSTNSATVPLSATLPIRDLEIGMQGDDVRLLQTLLIALGHSIPAGSTGYFGLQTKAALSAYQAANSIVPSVGYFGPLTRAQMNGSGIAGVWW